MKKEYNFSKVLQDKFYRPMEHIEVTVYLDKEVKAFFTKKAAEKKVKLEKIVNAVLRKEMEMLKEIGP